jgi:DNA-binding transcriptional ArsR family regulator
MSDGKSDPVPNPPGAGKRRRAPVEPAALKAFAHPLRMAMYTELQRQGSATASQLARSLGESSGQTSYHLRQLERHGFVEDDPLHPGGRDRWWRPVGFDLTEPSLMRDPETAGPVRAIVQQVIAERAAALSAWFSSLDPADDDGPGMLSSSTLALTREEAEELTTELNGVLTRLADGIRDRTPPDGAQRFRIHVDVFPLDGAGKP